MSSNFPKNRRIEGKNVYFDEPGAQSPNVVNPSVPYMKGDGRHDHTGIDYLNLQLHLGNMEMRSLRAQAQKMTPDTYQGQRAHIQEKVELRRFVDELDTIRNYALENASVRRLAEAATQWAPTSSDAPGQVCLSDLIETFALVKTVATSAEAREWRRAIRSLSPQEKISPDSLQYDLSTINPYDSQVKITLPDGPSAYGGRDRFVKETLRIDSPPPKRVSNIIYEAPQPTYTCSKKIN